MLAAVWTAAALSCVPYYTGREARQLQQAQQALESSSQKDAALYRA